MKRKELVFFLATLATACFFLATSAQAAEQAAPGAQEAGAIFKWINFAVLAALLLWVFAKKLPPIFRSNAQKIDSAVTTATAQKAEADRQLREAEAKLASLETTIAELRASAQREEAAEVARIQASTQSDSQKIALAARAEIEAAERAARLELKAIAAKLAVDGAESLLARQLTPQAQESLVANFVKSLEGEPN